VNSYELDSFFSAGNVGSNDKLNLAHVNDVFDRIKKVGSAVNNAASPTN
jgi:hypothetical protein